MTYTLEINIGNQIKLSRTSIGLTQEELAKLSNIPYTTLTKIESGIIRNPTLGKIHSITNALNITIDSLISIKSNINENSGKVTPFLKWAGGKRQLLPHLQRLIPIKYDNYIEPFIGGGAMFFFLSPKKAIISDTNEELINLYIQVRDNLSQLIDETDKLVNTKEEYYKIRSLSVNNLSAIQRAARTLYLNKTCFNGLYRVNKKGEFNVPYGSNPNSSIYYEKNIALVSEILKGKKILVSDYKLILLKHAKENDFIFLDPPYYPLGGYSDFKRYTKESFYDNDHLELRNIFKVLSERGCKVVLTNSNSKFINDIYSEFHKFAVDSRRSINSKGDKRTGQDLIIYSNIDLI